MLVTRTAELSDCGLYRYRLGRAWRRDRPTVMFLMLNPSTADATVDDRTVKRCTVYAMRWGFGALTVGNLFAYRSRDPRQLKEVEDPVGPGNDDALRSMIEDAGLVVASWGVGGSLHDREAVVKQMLGAKGAALRLTKYGEPCHPLRLPGDLTPFPWNPVADIANEENC